MILLPLLTQSPFSCLSDPLKDRTRPQTSENTEIQLVAGVANALRRDLNRGIF